jgi:hypothetical protein
VGALRWVQAAPGALAVKDAELNPREGDLVIFRSKAKALVEGTVHKRNGLKVRVEVRRRTKNHANLFVVSPSATGLKVQVNSSNKPSYPNCSVGRWSCSLALFGRCGLAG